MSDQRFPIHPEYVSFNGLNSHFKNVSPVRQVMHTGAMSQALIVDGRTRKRQQTGLEREIARGALQHTFRNDVIIRAVIPRFTDDMFSHLNGRTANPLDLVIFEDYRTEQLDVMELSKFHVMHQHFGFVFDIDEEIYNRLVNTKDTMIPAGTTLARSPAVTPDGDYMPGLETNVVMLSHPATDNDSIIFSESYTRRIQSNAFESRGLECGRHKYPINAYGNGSIFKPMPDVGEVIHSNGLLIATRPYDERLDAVYMTRKQLLKPIYWLDDRIVGHAGAEVVDIEVMHNSHLASQRLPEEMSRQFRKYYDADRRFYTELIRNTVFRTGRWDDGVNMSDRLATLVNMAIPRAGHMLVEEGMWPKNQADQLDVRLNYRGDLLDEWKVKITYRYKTEAGEGPKATDENGAKGVASFVMPDADMPVDKFGNRAEIAVLSNPTVNRMNPGRPHQQMIGAAGRDVIKRVRRTYGLPAMGTVSKEAAEHAVYAKQNAELNFKNFGYIVGFYKIVSKDRLYKLATRDDVIPTGRYLRHLVEVILDGNPEPGAEVEHAYGMFLQKVPESEDKLDEIIAALYEGEYRPEISTVTFRDYNGNMVTTKEEILIAPIYHLILEKTATDGSGVSSAKLNHFGVTSRLTNADKHSTAGRQTVTRSLDEASVRSMSAAAGAEIMAHITDLHNNPIVHKAACRKIITAEFPTNIPELVDRSVFKLGGHRPLAFAIHHFICSGKFITHD